VPLRSADDLSDEAFAMKSCVLSYVHEIAHNQSRLWSIRKDGARIATAELAFHDDDSMPSVIQLKVVGNKPAPAEV
jgi:hypothetical protein